MKSENLCDFRILANLGYMLSA